MMNNTNWFQRRNIAIKRTCTLNICVENTIKNSACAASSASPSSAQNVSLRKTAPVRFVFFFDSFTCVGVGAHRCFLYQQVVHIWNPQVEPTELQSVLGLKPTHTEADLQLLNCEYAQLDFNWWASYLAGSQVVLDVRIWPKKKQNKYRKFLFQK